MAFRFNKRVKIAPGVKLNIGKKGISTSIGPRGATVNISKKGIRKTASIPGTGIRHTSTSSFKTKNENHSTKDESMDEQKYLSHLNLVETLNTLHHDEFQNNSLSQYLDWKEDSYEYPATTEAESNLKNYKPSLMDKMLKKTDKRIDELKNAIISAKNKDAEALNELIAAKELATKVSEGQNDSYGEALELFSNLHAFSEQGIDLVFDFDKKPIECVVDVTEVDIIPTEKVDVTKAGNFTTKKLTAGEFHGLYKSYIVGQSIAIAKEILSILPEYSVVIQTIGYSQADEINSKGCIHSIIVERETLIDTPATKFDIDEYASFFSQNIKHLKTKGFKIVDRK